MVRELNVHQCSAIHTVKRLDYKKGRFGINCVYLLHINQATKVKVPYLLMYVYLFRNLKIFFKMLK